MKLDIQIKNFGKIKDAKIKLRPFTVIAGVNSSGKSFVTKALYSFFNTINKDHFIIGLIDIISVIKRSSSSVNTVCVKFYPSDNVRDDVKLFLSWIDEFEQCVLNEFVHNNLNEQISRAQHYLDSINTVDTLYANLEQKVLAAISKASQSRSAPLLLKESLARISESIEGLKLFLEHPEGVIATGFVNGFTNTLKDNFQVQRLTELNNYCSDSNFSFDFDTFGRITLDNEEIDFSIDSDGVDAFQNLYNVIFLESPIYWKIKNALSFARLERSKIYGNGETLTGIPQHFYDLVDLLDTRVKIDESKANDIDIYETINKAIGGEIDVSDTGDIYFKEKNSPRSININSTASGITNIGLIALLLKRHVIAKGSYLFIDEPEVNLHPAWQRVMAETLFKLSQNGINVVIASHSMDMMKAIENIMDEFDDKEVEQHFAINMLSTDGKSVNENAPVMKKIASVKADLGQPFYDMFLENEWQ